MSFSGLYVRGDKQALQIHWFNWGMKDDALNAFFKGESQKASSYGAGAEHLFDEWT